MKKTTGIGFVAASLALIGAAAFVFYQYDATEVCAAPADGHVIPSELKYTNRLINSKSPYLLQHAHNPVDWFPWSEEAQGEQASFSLGRLLHLSLVSCHGA